ncbi:AAA family ATPase [Reichenbachiella agariperforans]|uniref:Exodeoxyribonuclease-5 n=1 Tax=Reichenbachiella agariperforans TaxID=156994 RepID=A0A1M6SQZ7_REIAG|nr:MULTISPECIES: AAA family ATPase [Reichenbachiella]MBU2916235.1 AAA family ATPase [Reichenbachiella agariperforans]RJE75087.1 ATP-dependent endonuclease [Reichenbachiella sp. MSK19-1]SHK47115.1 exodeoxyribonuclease-5 [Reichenbachiella agariperforans]
MPLPSEILKNKFEHEPTASQAAMFLQFDQFIASREEKPTFVLQGYAGTGKTTTVGALVKTLPLFNYKFVLLAPTGRAAKVISQYSKRTAFTIHKRIYKTKTDKEDLGPVFSKTKNYQSNTVFIVDEASMISAESDYQSGSLLSDLIDYVFETQNNKLILIGDTAQLPPVHQSKSLALDTSYLSEVFNLNVYGSTLTEITRQAADSGILVNATSLRNALGTKSQTLSLQTKSHTDIYRMTSEKLEDGLRYAHDKYGIENTLVICRSNKNAVMYNHYIRNQLLYREGELEAGDLLMIARNNYSFATDEVPSGFLANGDFMEVLKIKRDEELHGLRFADLEIQLVDYPDVKPFEVKVLLEGLHSYSPSMSREDNQALYRSVLADYADLPRAKQKEAMKQDPYLNALQVKYAYALTCHKSQGGQWDAVFVDQGYLGEEYDATDFIRWAYTAMTRAKTELFLVNFDKKFF